MAAGEEGTVKQMFSRFAEKLKSSTIRITRL